MTGMCCSMLAGWILQITQTIKSHPTLPAMHIYFIYYKIVHTVQDRQNGQSNIKSGIKAK